jgi:hypothetical protein
VESSPTIHGPAPRMTVLRVDDRNRGCSFVSSAMVLGYE